MHETDVLRKAAAYVCELLPLTLPPSRRFHTLSHTLEVVKACWLIGTDMKLSEEDLEVLMLAAYFHDTGHISAFEAHEEESQLIAELFLKEIAYPRDKIEKVLACIDATRLNHTAENLLEKIICDADLFHLGSRKYLKYLHLLRKEWQEVLGLKYTEANWTAINIQFLYTHKYHTPYARKAKGIQKRANLLFLCLKWIGAMLSSPREMKNYLTLIRQKKMNPIYFPFFVLLGIILLVFACNKQDTIKVSETVKDMFQQQYPHARQVNWAMKEDRLEVEFEWKGGKIEPHSHFLY